MILNYNNFLINESIKDVDLNKLVTIVKVDKDTSGNLIYITDDDKEFFLPKEDIGKVTLIDDKFINFINSGHPIVKYFETTPDNRTIIYASNFAVDIIALKRESVYLIERKDGRGWALPGGFIDKGEKPYQSALREFEEECVVNQDDIENIKPLPIVKCNDPREINFYTYPFIMYMKESSELEFADDAKDGKWILLNDALNLKLAFSHHTEILNQVRKMI